MQSTEGTLTLDRYIQRDYIHARLAESIPPDVRYLVCIPSAIDVFSLGVGFAVNNKEKMQLEVNSDSRTPEAQAMMHACQPIYDLGYEVGQALVGSAILDAQADETGLMALMNFTSANETILENLCTFFDPDHNVVKVRETNRNNPLLRSFLPPETKM